MLLENCFPAWFGILPPLLTNARGQHRRRKAAGGGRGVLDHRRVRRERRDEGGPPLHRLRHRLSSVITRTLPQLCTVRVDSPKRSRKFKCKESTRRKIYAQKKLRVDLVEFSEKSAKF